MKVIEKILIAILSFGLFFFLSFWSLGTLLTRSAGDDPSAQEAAGFAYFPILFLFGVAVGTLASYLCIKIIKKKAGLYVLGSLIIAWLLLVLGLSFIPDLL